MKIFKLILGILLIVSGGFLLLGAILEFNNSSLIENIILISFLCILPVTAGVLLIFSVLKFK